VTRPLIGRLNETKLSPPPETAGSRIKNNAKDRTFRFTISRELQTRFVTQTHARRHPLANPGHGRHTKVAVQQKSSNWTLILNAQATESTISLIDTNAPGFNARFYRAKQF